MSLQVWLPLNGDLHNQGLSGNLAVTTVGTVTYDNAGKIGKCFISGGTSQVTNGININSNLIDILNSPNGCSIALWVKPVGNHVHYNGTFISSGNWNATRWSFGVSQNNSQVDVLCQGHNNYITCSVPVNEWTHLVGVFKNGVSKVYKNGQYVGELTGVATTFASDASNTCIGRETYASGYFGFNGRINDVRIYDHALSPKEVEEIAKGLVLHYKLDYSNPNLLSKYVTPGQAAPGGTATAGRTNYYGDYGIIIPAAENADTYFRLFLKQQLTQNTVYTISCYVSGLLPGSQYNFPLFSQGNASMGVLSLNHNGICSLTFTMNSSTQTSVTAPDGSTVYICFMDDSARTLASGQGAITVTGFKIEQGNIATPFNTGNSSVIYDSSGYSHNGTITGSLTAAASSPRYDVCTHLESSSPTTNNNTGLTYIQSPLGLTAPTQMSVCWWGHPESGYSGASNNAAWCTSASSGEPTDYNQTAFHHRDAKFDICLNSASSTSLSLAFSNYTLNEWHYYCVTYDGKIAILYKDGIETNRSTISSTEAPLKTFTKIVIGFSKAGGVWRKTLGSYSDFRVYTTALTAAQVKELYNTSMSVDSNGNVYARELSEL